MASSNGDFVTDTRGTRRLKVTGNFDLGECLHRGFPNLAKVVTKRREGGKGEEASMICRLNGGKRVEEITNIVGGKNAEVTVVSDGLFK